MKRVMVNLDDETGRLVAERSAAERRSISSYIVLLVEQDLRASGVLSDSDTTSELLTAAREVGMAPAIAAVRKIARRKPSTPAVAA